jgi:hypothetical protein
VAVYSEAESPRALDAILLKAPQVLAIDPQFAKTARGAAIVARIRTDARLNDIDLRVLIEDETNLPLVFSKHVTSIGSVLLESTRPLDRAGTRQAVRFPMGRRRVLVNGEEGELVDLSMTGAQVLTSVRMGPGNTLRIALPDDGPEVRCQGSVAWSVAVPTSAGVQYRGGIAFTNADSAQLESFCTRHGGSPDHIFGNPDQKTT